MKRKLNLTAKKSLSVSCYVRLLETRQDSSGKVYLILCKIVLKALNIRKCLLHP